jgi:hypothetical protein
MSRHIASWLTVIAAIAGISGGLAYYKLRETAAANFGLKFGFQLML